MTELELSTLIKLPSAVMPNEDKKDANPKSSEGKSEKSSHRGEGGNKDTIKTAKRVTRSGKVDKKRYQVKSIWPTVIDLQQYERRKYYPESYYSNTKKENVLLWLANKFGEICAKIDPQRRSIILVAENECRIQKMVCTTIRPTKIRYPEFYRWQGCAQFIADNIEYEPLEKPVIFPQYIRSPDTVLERQKANCFELAILLVSCLIGSGYDAYVVSGFATREVCINNQTRTKCPYIPKEERREEQTVQKKENKYIPQPPPDFSSKFRKMMRERELKRIADLEKQAADKERQRIKELEKLPPDDMFGYRRHSWVLVLNGSRGVEQTFFIEPTTGVGISTDDERYLGVDSVWNAGNYWFCLQREKPQHFELINPDKWRQFIVKDPWREYGENEEGHKLDYNDTILARKHMDVINSWVKQLEIPYKKYQERYPNGSKQTSYYKAKCQLYAPYVLDSGLVQCINIYEDYEYKGNKFKYELFKNRHDCLYKIETNMKTCMVVEYFRKGREDSLEQYQYKSNGSDPPMDLLLQFYHTACYDGLYKMTLKPNLMIIEYLNRDDFLRFKYCEFRPKEESEKQERCILSVREIFDKNPVDKPHESIAMRDFDLKGDKIQIRYHHSTGKLVSSVKNFQKVQATENCNEITFQSELCLGYEFDSTAKTHNEDLEALFRKLLIIEKQTIANVQKSFEKIESFLAARDNERTAPRLKVSIFDPLRNERTNQEMRKKEEVDSRRAKNEIEGELDYLLPYFVKFENRRLSYDEAQQLYKKCLFDFKNQQQKRAVILQDKFNYLNEMLNKKEKEFEIKVQMNDENREALASDIEQLKYRLRIFEIRLARHEKLTTQRYQSLVEKLQSDPRLQVLERGR